MDKPFVHLHVHSEYSLLDGAIRCKELAEKTASWGSPAVALTDHGVMYGVIEFYEACKNAGVKPVIGCEVYVDPRGHTRKDRSGRNYHLLLLAENDKGYENLVKLVSIANTDGFYYKPRVDHDLLASYSEGLIASSACLAGEIPSLLLDNDEEGALRRAGLYSDIFGKESFFLEVMHNSLPEQAVANKGLIELSKKTGISLVATNDAHYLNASDASWHDVLLCVQTNSTVNTPGRMRFSGDDFYLRSPEEMWALFGAELPEALENTVAIAERCKVDFTFGQFRLPRVDVPEGESLESMLQRMAEDGLSNRFEGNVPAEYVDRLRYELNVIREMGFAGYFIIVADIIRTAKAEHIPVGPGRGSAAGSVAAWALDITEIDPLRYGLLFERFLNPERISMPDIDTDISDKRREQVLEKIVEKYGRERVSQIITFDRMKSKAAVRDVGRALDMTYSDVDKVAKLIPPTARDIGEAMEQAPELAQRYEQEPEVKRLLDFASSMEGLARHCSQHAAGVVITPEPLMDTMPVRRIGDNQVVTQFAMEPVEKLGLVKMDFLGLRTLSLIEDALENIRQNSRVAPDLYDLPLNDPKTFDLLCWGDTLGVFQLESSGMRQLLRRLRPDSFEDLIAVLALYRPGPLGSGMVDTYIDCKHGRKEIQYLHPKLENVLSETYGIILYQEQVMQAAATIAGYSLGQADLLRRAMGKKKVEVMEKERVSFVQGCLSNGVDRSRAEHLFDIIQEFAGYGFNKSHSTAYAMVSFHTAYLKAHFPVEFYAAFLSSQIHSKLDVLGRYVRTLKDAGIDILPPDINRSMANFSVDGDVVLFGLNAVAKVGHTAVEAILEERRKGPFSSLWDFINRVDLRTVNRAVVENLVRAGAFDGVSGNRRQCMESMGSMIEIVQRKSSDGRQRSLLDLVDDDVDETPALVETDDYDFHTRMQMEKDATGLYISGHPYDQYRDVFAPYVTCSISDLSFWKQEKIPAIVAGLVVGVEEKYTKKGEKMAIVELEDGEAKIEGVCFPRMWAALKEPPQKGSPYLVKGSPRDRDGLNIIVDSFVSALELEKSANRWVRLRVGLDGPEETERFRNVYRELKGYPGSAGVLVEIRKDGFCAIIRPRDLKVDPSKPFSETVAAMSGGAVEVI